MDIAAKEYADAMEKGWNLCPVMNPLYFYSGSPTEPTSCCANGHAALGANGSASSWIHFEDTVEHVKVRVNKRDIELYAAVDILTANGWTTPQIVAWIRECNKD